MRFLGRRQLPSPASAPAPAPAIDRARKARLAGLVFERTGVPIDAADPAFALVELNRLVLQETGDELFQRITKEADGMPMRLSLLTTMAGEELVKHARKRIAEEAHFARREFEDEVSRERDNLRQYADASRAAQQRLGAQLERSTRTVVLVCGALTVLVVVLAIATVGVLLVIQEHPTVTGRSAAQITGR